MQLKQNTHPNSNECFGSQFPSNYTFRFIQEGNQRFRRRDSEGWTEWGMDDGLSDIQNRQGTPATTAAAGRGVGAVVGRGSAGRRWEL